MEFGKGDSMRLILIVLVLPLFCLVAAWTDRTLEFWLTYFKGVEVDVPYWISLVITVVFNALILGINIVSELLRLVI